MEDNKYDDLSDQLKNYANTNIELVKMQAIEQVVIIAPRLLSTTIITVIIYMAVTFLSIGLSIYLSTLLNSMFYGFLIVGGFYFLLGVIFITARKSLVITPLRNLIIKTIFKLS